MLKSCLFRWQKQDNQKSPAPTNSETAQSSGDLNTAFLYLFRTLANATSTYRGYDHARPTCSVAPAAATNHASALCVRICRRCTHQWQTTTTRWLNVAAILYWVLLFFFLVRLLLFNAEANPVQLSSVTARRGRRRLLGSPAEPYCSIRLQKTRGGSHLRFRRRCPRLPSSLPFCFSFLMYSIYVCPETAFVLTHGRT